MLPRLHTADVPIQDLALLLKYFNTQLNLVQRSSLEMKYRCKINTDKYNNFINASIVDVKGIQVFPTNDEERTIISLDETESKMASDIEISDTDRDNSVGMIANEDEIAKGPDVEVGRSIFDPPVKERFINKSIEILSHTHMLPNEEYKMDFPEYAKDLEWLVTDM